LEVSNDVAVEETRIKLLKKEKAKPKEISIAWKNINVHLNLQPTLVDLASKITRSKEQNESTSKHIIKDGKQAQLLNFLR
jgi:hypothetical protein